jgi:hypothetical protein
VSKKPLTKKAIWKKLRKLNFRAVDLKRAIMESGENPFPVVHMHTIIAELDQAIKAMAPWKE